MLFRTFRRYSAGLLVRALGVLAPAFVVACNDNPVQPVVSSSDVASSSAFTQQSTVVRPDEALLLQVSAQLPEFGGLYLDATGKETAYLTDLSKQAQALAILSITFGSYKASAHVPGSGSTIFRQAQYTFSQLATMRDQMSLPILALADVVFTDLDESRNRLVVGVSNMSAAKSVTSQLKSLGIPAGAVIIEKAEAPRLAKTLRSAMVPRGGGLEISTTNKHCTFGFNAAWGPNATPLFVTAAHCTPVTWGPDASDFYQPTTVNPANYLGYEYWDPPGTTCGAGLLKCRMSDAVLIRNLTPANFQLGLVYATIGAVTGGYGSLTLGTHTGKITSETTGILVGDYLEKIGAVTGWTYGQVKNTCVDVLIGARVVQCSIRTENMTAYFGDSGAPALVYQGYVAPNYRFSLAGMVFAVGDYLGNGIFKSTYVSPMSGIEADVGALTTH